LSDVSNPRLKNILESLLFVCKKPLNPAELVQLLESDENRIEQAIRDLAMEYENRGVKIVNVAGGWQMVTSVENADHIDRLLMSPIVTTLSPAALETLALIAYKQPVTRLDIENVRGISSDGVVKTLLEKRMIREIGRSDAIGRPILYSTTTDFLRHFGLKDLGDLPELPMGSMDQAKIFKDGVVLPPEIEPSQLSLSESGIASSIDPSIMSAASDQPPAQPNLNL
jgi:segregation and condensation protein B